MFEKQLTRVSLTSYSFFLTCIYFLICSYISDNQVSVCSAFNLTCFNGRLPSSHVTGNAERTDLLSDTEEPKITSYRAR